ncbi:MAG: AAA family ATPase [Myxococcales bacterium]|nr:AAA family ATPase [Myxococcales bacterium]
MIIDRLIVERYGHFERLELDLGSGRGGLTVIWGANEAGKSTLLHAVRDLFFGIDHQTPLAFRFDYKSMRIRASLRDSAGQRLAVERRKKRKHSLTGTLSSQAGVVDLDDERFAAYFGGIRADLYNALFGFDLGDLQRGAGVLEDAGLSEVLGGSALGGSGDRIRQVLADLHREGRDLYKNQGKVPAINRGLAQVRETQTALREATLQQGAYQDLTARLARIRREIDANGAELAEERAARARAQAILTALPEARELAALRRELAAAGPASAGLDEEGARRALRLVAEAAIAGARSAALAAEIAQQEARIAGIAVDEALLAEEAAIERVTRRAAHQAALRREVAGEQAALALDRKKLAEETADMEGVEPPAGAALDRLRELVERWARAAAEVAEAARADQQQRADIEAARAILGRDQDDADDREALHLALELEELGDRRAQLDRLAAEALRLETEISAGLAPFGLALDAAAAAELALPEVAALADALARRGDLDERGRRLARRARPPGP